MCTLLEKTWIQRAISTRAKTGSSVIEAFDKRGTHEEMGKQGRGQRILQL